MNADDFWKKTLAALPRLRARGRRLTGSAADADDLVQETLLRAMGRTEQLRDPSKVPGWLAAVQKTVYLNARRAPRFRLELVQPPGTLAEPSGDLSAELAERGVSDEMAFALASLPEEWRAALLLRELEELSYEEIARRQGCPVGTVRSRLARARAAMALALREAGHERVQR